MTDQPSTITEQQQAAIRLKLAGMEHLSRGIGSEESACSIAAINLALTGKLTDKIPDCMSEVIGNWIIRIQDAMPAEMRDSAEWRELLPLAAGTGRAHERERADILLDWMWSKVLPQLSDVAEVHGFEPEWEHMLTKRTPKAAAAAAYAAKAWAAAAAAAAYAATEAEAEEAAAWAAAAAAEAADAAPETAVFWINANPIGTLRKLVEVGQ